MRLFNGTAVFGLIILGSLLLSLSAPGLKERGTLPYIVTDLTGCQVDLSGPAKEAMLFTPSAWHYVTVDETDQNIQAIAAFMTQEIKGELLDHIFPGLSMKEPVLGQAVAVARPLSLELVLVAKPDILLNWAHFSHEFLYIKYPGLIQVPANFDTSELYGLLGRLTGKNGRVSYLYRRFHEQLAVLSAHLPLRPEKLLTAMPLNGHLHIMGRNFISVNTNLNRVGLKHIAQNYDSRQGPLNLEVFLELDPDFIFLYFHDLSFSVDDVYTHPVLGSLKASRMRQVYRLPKGTSRLEGPVEEPILAAWLSKIAYPEMSEPVSLREQIKNTYHEFFGYEMTQEEIDHMLQMKENRGSANYEQFVAAQK
ncbi:MAG: hypothetical protein LBP22_09185 [Deltaproteobacteria bacterium]|jgi:iron complex transport system substrate-binding protein|nr:hypothetical protein [Deltaproteobacteria bacterium]